MTKKRGERPKTKQGLKESIRNKDKNNCTSMFIYTKNLSEARYGTAHKNQDNLFEERFLSFMQYYTQLKFIIQIICTVEQFISRSKFMCIPQQQEPFQVQQCNVCKSLHHFDLWLYVICLQQLVILAVGQMHQNPCCIKPQPAVVESKIPTY